MSGVFTYQWFTQPPSTHFLFANPFTNCGLEEFNIVLSAFIALMKPKGQKLQCHDSFSKSGQCETKLSCYTYLTHTNRNRPFLGCVENENAHLFMCNAIPTQTFIGKCCNEDLCNNKLNLTFNFEEPTPKRNPSKLLFCLLCCAFFEDVSDMDILEETRYLVDIQTSLSHRHLPNASLSGMVTS